ncbi:MAG: 50S ribosomal protein L1 [Candidatus Neomarinimicrobiota bacterium]
MKRGKKYRSALEKIDRLREYSVSDAMSLLKDVAGAQFDETVQVAVNLGVDPRHADQNVRVTAALPHGTGKEVRVLVLATGPRAKGAEDAGTDFVGGEEFIQKLESGWDEVDVIVAEPSMMPKLGKLGRILGPKGLMPNPKSGTVTDDVASAVKEIKGGRIELRVDRFGIIHAPIGKVSFEADHLSENLKWVISTLMDVRPSSVKGAYLRKVTVSSSMGPGVKIDKSTLV